MNLQQILEALKTTMRRQDAQFQRSGELISKARKLKVTFEAIGKAIGYPPSTVRNYYRAWEIAPTIESLQVGTKTGTYAHALVAHEVYCKARKAAKDSGRKFTGQDKRKIFEDVVAGGLTSREGRTSIEKAILAREKNRLEAEAVRTRPLTSWHNHCHNSDCACILASLPDGSIDFAHLDPPYWGYRDSQGDDGLRQASYRESVLVECVGRKGYEAKAKMLELIPLLARKLSPKGVVLYWNTGLKADDWEVMKAFEENGLPNLIAGVWDKMGTSPMEMNTPHTVGFERWTIQCREKKVKSWSYDESRNNIIRLSPIHKKKTLYHLMEKPVALLQDHFLAKYCPPKSLIFDAYGCSGACCLAALNLGHRFIYCEADKPRKQKDGTMSYSNFQYGSGLIAQRMEELRQAKSA